MELRGNIEYRGKIKKLDQCGFGRYGVLQPSTNADIYGYHEPYDLDPNLRGGNMMVEVE